MLYWVAIYTLYHSWKTARIQPSPLALRQIEAMLKEISLSAERKQLELCHQLLVHYFSEASSTV
jgi:hypothetical protein